MAAKTLKQKIATYLFNREMRHYKRNPQTIPFDQVKTIGIIYEATEEKNYELVKNYVKEMREQQRKDVLALGYVDLNELPAMRFAKLGLDFFTKKDLTWYMKPNHPMVSKFIHREFDILINLDIDKCFPVNYVNALAKAHIKIGRFDKRNSHFCDFLIKTDENTTLKQFIEHVNQYLKRLGNQSKPQTDFADFN